MTTPNMFKAEPVLCSYIVTHYTRPIHLHLMWAPRWI